VTIGILGGGQLGYMLALAGYPLDFHFRFLDPSPQAPVGRVASRVTAEYSDFEALEKFAHGLTLVTYEFETFPSKRCASCKKPFRSIRHRRLSKPHKTAYMKNRFSENLPSPPRVRSGKFCRGPGKRRSQLGLTRHFENLPLGYDGKGQWVLRTGEDVERVRNEIPSAPLILEEFVKFSRELSILAVRARNGETAFYRLVENHHRDGILRLSLAPAPRLTEAMQREAEAAARRVLESLDYVGVLAIELSNVTASAGQRNGSAGPHPATGPSKVPSPASSKTIFARFPVCRLVTPELWAFRQC